MTPEPGFTWLSGFPLGKRSMARPARAAAFGETSRKEKLSDMVVGELRLKRAER